MTDILKMVCGICKDICVFVDRNYCAKEFVTVCTPCYKELTKGRELNTRYGDVK